ncbi:CC/Se motif family (seleno)protein [Thermotalea metallivorans]|uniref:CC/Se motif family (seleno)protein n=1 Tax=Thermotalea metallivorans TaxID=520762 RepID=UPI00241FC01A|nr:CC/Se motif family (seleno)protein [Thermotalea metallivorans]
MPHVKVGAPVESGKYDRYMVDGLEIYVYKGAVVKNALRITLANYLFFKEIEVAGIQMI